MTNLSELYDFRVNDGNVTSMHPNRRRAAKKVQTLNARGVPSVNIVAETRKNGEWVEDHSVYKLAEKYTNEAKLNGKSKTKEVSLNAALRDLAAASKLAASANPITEAHMEAVLERMGVVHGLLSESQFAGLDEEEETEDEETEDTVEV